MDTKKTAKLIESATVAIYCFEEGELYSKGSGVVVSSSGHVLTAAHVVTNHKGLKPEEIISGSVVVLCRTTKGAYKRYLPVAGDITASMQYFKKPIHLDLMLLQPIGNDGLCSYIQVSSSKSIVAGEEILIGGFPEDVVMPFDLPNIVRVEDIQGFSSFDQISKELEMFNRFLTIKRAIVSKVFEFDFAGTIDAQPIGLSGFLFYFDNVMHSGGSGGPVVNSEGQLIGIITNRATIELNYVDSPKGIIPSGSGTALSCLPLFQFMHKPSGSLFVELD